MSTPTQPIADWLEKLGLGQYAQRFAENDISFSILADLTDQDLKELGVASLGHRRQLLREISNLGKTADAAQSAPSRPVPPIAAPTVTATAEAAGERRHVSVMFCDLVDSTGISAKLEAEEWRDLVGAYLDAASAAVTEMGGKVAKKLGDGLMALFGHPVAQENDAERAVRAARSPNGAASASAASMFPPSGGSRSSRVRSRRSSSTRRRTPRCSPLSSTFRCRRNAFLRWRPTNCAGANWPILIVTCRTNVGGASPLSAFNCGGAADFLL
jgi:hypothetical protein